MSFSGKKVKLINEAFDFIEKIGWKKFNFKRFSEYNQISISELNSILISKNNLLKQFSKMIDLNVEKNFDFESLKNTSTKDNLFELIMLRLEFMQPYKESLKKIIMSLKTDPTTTKSISLNVLESLDFYLELTDAYDNSIFDILKKKSFLILYSYIFMVWLDDKTDELSRTMSELDKVLSLSEKMALNFRSYTPF